MEMGFKNSYIDLLPTPSSIVSQVNNASAEIYSNGGSLTRNQNATNEVFGFNSILDVLIKNFSISPPNVVSLSLSVKLDYHNYLVW